MENPTPLADAFDELKDYAEDVAQASFQNVHDTMRRFAHLLHSEQPIGALRQKLLPQVDFDAWYQETSSPKFGMSPAARLEWPPKLAQRVALQAELIRRIASEKIDLDDFLDNFSLVSSDYKADLKVFATQLLFPFHRDLQRLAHLALESERASSKTRINTEESKPLPFPLVAKQRLAQLDAIQSREFDLQRLIQLCRELDFCFRNECLLAVAALTRALLDHVPPIFAKQTFAEVANNYAGGTSFKDSMRHLDNSARSIGDTHLHVKIRARESLPTPIQVNFSNDLDVLLAEVVRILSP